MREGIIITKVIPNKHGSESATEYEVDFERFKAIFYQVECGLLSPLSTARLSGTARRTKKTRFVEWSHSRQQFSFEWSLIGPFRPFRFKTVR
jgi:hypothetical protein